MFGTLPSYTRTVLPMVNYYSTVDTKNNPWEQLPNFYIFFFLQMTNYFLQMTTSLKQLMLYINSLFGNDVLSLTFYRNSLFGNDVFHLSVVWIRSPPHLLNI
jgi:hypothetical protein